MSRNVSIRLRAAAAVLLCLAVLCAAGGALAEAVDSYDAAHPELLTPEDITGKAALVMDADSGALLFEKNIDRQTYPASTTKIMTALLALENSSPDDMVTIPKEAVDIPWDSSKVPVTAGEEIPMIDLLYGMMMKSGNDAAIAIALHVAGSQQAFVDMMNERAAELGCKNTHFVNPHGYHDPKHVSTARDLALIAREAMKSETFRDIVSAKSYTMPATKFREKLRLETSYSMFVSSSKYYYPYLNGVKTGYHSKAGYCFVGSAELDGVTLISVTLKTSKEGRWTDTRRLMDYGVSRYTTYSFDQLYELAPLYASISGAAHGDEDAGLLKLRVVPEGSISRYTRRVLNSNFDQALKEFSAAMSVEYTNDLKAPVLEGDILGKLTFNSAGGPLTATLIASRDVDAEATPFTLKSLFPGLAEGIGGNFLPIALGALILLIALIVIIRVRAVMKRNRRRKEMLRRRKAAYDRYRTKR